MNKLKRMVTAGVVAGVATLGGISAAASAHAETAHDLGCDYWWDANTFSATCNTDFMAHATCNDGTDLDTGSGWTPAGRQTYLYCASHGGYKAGTGGALSK
jgi:hypothetical protein